MGPRRVLATISALAVGSALIVATGTTPAASAQRCHPFTTEATYAGEIPTAREVLGFDLGNREVSVGESDRYLRVVDEASSRVQGGTLAISHQGRALRYAVLGAPAQVEATQDAATVLRDPQTPPAVADEIAAEAPAILWVAGNVHGGEESGTDASLRVLYELADRTDCAARRIRNNSVVVVLPTQNPDGRVADTRRNAYGFDMNRDWFARTQPETDGKLEVLREYPSVLFIDDHEMGSKDFFFPPNADPFYHEITDESVHWINDVYGAAMADEFDRQDIPYFNRDVYDMFYMGYGDTVPTTGFLGAGMTFEKQSYAAIHKRVYEQYVAIWASLSAAAANKDAILSGWASSYREAYQQGVDGELEPNQVINPGNEVQQPVPTYPVRHYFIRDDNPAKVDEVQALVRRLQRMDVEVRQLTAPLEVPDYRPYGRASRPTTLPAGTYWVPMAQAQKHWVQAMLHEDTYVPFPYFYDVTAWSQPLLYNVAGGRSGRVLEPQSVPAPTLGEPAPPPIPDEQPALAVWQMNSGTDAVESSGWLRWLLTEKWDVNFQDISAHAIKHGGLAGVDVLVVPNGSAYYGELNLGNNGARDLRAWVRGGGRLVAYRGGAELAARLGLTSAVVSDPTSDVPGSMLRVRVDGDSPLSRGVGPFAWTFYEYDLVMEAADPSTVPVSYPPAGHPDFFVSGFAQGEQELGRTAAVVDEPYGEGRAVLFGSDPNYRAFTDGMQVLLHNALFGPDPVGTRPARHVGDRRTDAAAAAHHVRSLSGRMVVSVRPAAADSVRAIFDRYGIDARSWRVAPAKTRFTVPMQSAEQSPIARDVVADLSRLGSQVVAVRLP